MADFFQQLDELEAAYRERTWTAEEWQAEIRHHLEMIDRLLPDYAMLVGGEAVTVAFQERALIPDYTLEEDPALLRDLALRVASLFCALDGALSDETAA